MPSMAWLAKCRIVASALRNPRDSFGGHADAADRGQDPHFVARGGAAVGAQEALPDARWMRQLAQQLLSTTRGA